MKTKLAISAIVLVCTGLLFMVVYGQVPGAPTTFAVNEQPLPPVGVLTANYTGNSGTTQYCYAAVARYGVGNAALGPVSCINNVDPSSAGTVALSWAVPTIANPPITYTLAYDVVRLIGSTVFPSSGTCTNCLVSSATTGTTATDTVNGSLSSYTQVTYAIGAHVAAVDNTSTIVSMLTDKVISRNGSSTGSFGNPTQIGRYTLTEDNQGRFTLSSSLVSSQLGIQPVNGGSSATMVLRNNGDINNHGRILFTLNGALAQTQIVAVGSGVIPTLWNIFWQGNGTTSAFDPTGFATASYKTLTNCSSSASPAVCAAANAGSFVLAAGATSVQVNTTSVTANSQIQITPDASLGTKLGVTCNTTPPTFQLSNRTAATSFTLTGTAPTTNPNCFSYSVVN